MGPAPLVLFSAALTGAATLAAEMLWIRGLGRGIGTTYEAVAMVAGLFLAGLGLGARIGARYAPLSARPARAGTWLLAAAGTGIALSPLYIGIVPDLRSALFAPDAGGLLTALLLQLPFVTPVALLLGAVFPFLVRARVEDVAHAGSRTGGIYAANTAGAVAGVLLLLPVLASAGETMTLRLTGAAALLGAFLLLLADRPLPHGEGPPKPVEPGQTLTASGLGPALFISGAAALLAQMAWLRMLQPLAGAHLYGVALLLAPLLLALALGAAVAGPIADRARRPSTLVPALLAAAGAFLVISLPVAGGAPLRVVSGGDRSWALVWAFVFTVAPATILFGAVLPAAVRLRAAWSGSTARPAGRLFAWNAFGALGGSLLAGYLLLPRFGAERTLFVAAALVVAAAVVLRWRVPSKRRLPAVVLHALPLVILAWPGLLAAWLGSSPTAAEVIAATKPLPRGMSIESREDMELYARWFAGRRAQRTGEIGDEALPTFEGRGGRIVLIEETDGRIGLRRAGLRESVFDPDRTDTPARTEYALGLLPSLLHPEPRRALVIGHGAGWSAEAMLVSSRAQVEVAEIDPVILEAARAVRGLERLPVEAHDRGQLRPADGRVLLRDAARDEALRYDVIASQPSHPWHPISGHLFTVEAYRAAHAALREGGIHAQWLNLFDMSPALLRSALASYRAVFTHAWVFRFPGELVLVGFREKPQVPAGRWETFFRADNKAAAAARAAGFTDAGGLLKHIVLDTAGLDGLLPPGTELLHDDLPRLELELAARRLRGAAPEDVDAVLMGGFPPDLTAILPQAEGRERWITAAVTAWLDEGAAYEADQWSRKLRWGNTPDGLATKARAALAANEPVRADGLLRRARQMAPARGDLAALWIRTATDLVGTGSRIEHRRRAEVAAALVEAMPEDGLVLAAHASLLRTMGNVEDARAAFLRAAKATAPEPPPGLRIRYARLILSEAYGPEEAKQARELIAADPETYTDVDALDLLLRLAGAAGDEEEARTLEQSLATLQRTQGLALLRRAGGALGRHDFTAALESARRCTGIWPERPEPFELLALAALGRGASEDVPELDRQVFEREAADALRSAIERSSDEAAARARGERILAWFGRDPAQLTPRPDADAE